MANIKIYGAGMAGLLAGAILSKRHNVQIFEKKENPEQSHHALLRFKNDSIEQSTGIKCDKVSIKKAIFYKNQLYNESNIKFDNEYSYKVVGNYSNRSIGDLSTGTRYIPPADFYDRLLKINKDRIHYGQAFGRGTINKDDIIISTIPMPHMYTLVYNGELQFNHNKITIVKMKLDFCNIHQTIYFPDCSIDFPAYRISINGNQLIAEVEEHSIDRHSVFQNIEKTIKEKQLQAFGIDKSTVVSSEIKHQKYGKIININDDARQSIIYNLTQKYNIYSLGRFACWRNHTMLADVVQDIYKIEKWISQKECLSPYEIQKSI